MNWGRNVTAETQQWIHSEQTVETTGEGGHTNIFVGMQLRKELRRQRQNQVCIIKGMWANFCLWAQWGASHMKLQNVWGDRMTKSLYCFSIAEEMGLSISRSDSNSSFQKSALESEGDFSFPFLYKDYFLLFPFMSHRVPFKSASEKDGLSYLGRLESEFCLCQALWAWWSLFIS